MSSEDSIIFGWWTLGRVALSSYRFDKRKIRTISGFHPSSMKELGAFHSTVSSLDIYKDLFLPGDALLFLTMDVPLLRGITVEGADVLDFLSPSGDQKIISVN